MLGAMKLRFRTAAGGGGGGGVPTIVQNLPIAAGTTSLTITTESKIVVLATVDGNAAVTGVTWGATSLTAVSGSAIGSGSSSGGAWLGIWELDTPTPGTHTLSLTTGRSDVGMRVITLDGGGVTQAALDTDSGASLTTRTLTVTADTDDSLALSFVNSNTLGDGGTPSSGWADLGDAATGGGTDTDKGQVSAAAMAVSAGAVSITWTPDDGQFTSVSVSALIVVQPL